MSAVHETSLLREQIAALGEWFHNLDLAGISTAPTHFLGDYPHHVRHPLLALDLIHEHVARDLLVFQSMQRGSEEVSSVGSDYPKSMSAAAVMLLLKNFLR